MKDSSAQSPAGKRAFPFRWLFTLRMLRRIVICLAWAATLMALWYAEENWRCRRAWDQYRKAAEARGEHLDWKYFIPKPIPDDRNFAMYGSLPNTLFSADPEKRQSMKDNFSRAGRPILSAKAVPSFHFTDLSAWEKALTAATAPGAPGYDKNFDVAANPDPASRAAAAPGVLRLMQDDDAIIEELRTASSRPDARYPINYDAENPAMIGLPYYSQLQGICQRLRIKACAELALGRNDDAMKDLKLMFYLSDSTKNESFLIALLVRNSLLAIETQVIREGLDGHCWTDAQLREIQQELLSRNLVAEMQSSLEMEQASMIRIAEYYRRHGGFSGMIADIERFGGREAADPADITKYPLNPLRYLMYYWSRKLSRSLIWLMPGGWFHLEEIDGCKRFEARVRSAFDPAAKRIFPLRLESNVRAETSPPTSDLKTLLEHRFIFQNTIAVIESGLIRKHCAGAQCNADQAAIACALERYRLAKGVYPAQLDALAPEFIPALPLDSLTGEAYRYRTDGGNGFVLYSVGWNLRDDGGKPGGKGYGEDGDWVW